MAKKSYSEKLLDPRWQRKRLEVLERDGWACQDCGSSNKTLHVHHGFYKAETDPWDYHSDTLVTLCKDCHETEEKMRRTYRGSGDEALAMLKFSARHAGYFAFCARRRKMFPGLNDAWLQCVLAAVVVDASLKARLIEIVSDSESSVHNAATSYLMNLRAHRECALPVLENA